MKTIMSKANLNCLQQDMTNYATGLSTREQSDRGS